MEDFIRLVGPQQAVEIIGVRLVGVNAENGKKLLFTIVYVALVLMVSRLLLRSSAGLVRDAARRRAAFWARQAIGAAKRVACPIYRYSLGRSPVVPTPCQ